MVPSSRSTGGAPGGPGEIAATIDGPDDPRMMPRLVAQAACNKEQSFERILQQGRGFNGNPQGWVA